MRNIIVSMRNAVSILDKLRPAHCVIDVTMFFCFAQRICHHQSRIKAYNFLFWKNMEQKIIPYSTWYFSGGAPCSSGVIIILVLYVCHCLTVACCYDYRSASYWSCKKTTSSGWCEVDTFIVEPHCGVLEAHIAHITKSDALVTVSFLARWESGSVCPFPHPRLPVSETPCLCE